MSIETTKRIYELLICFQPNGSITAQYQMITEYTDTDGVLSIPATVSQPIEIKDASDPVFQQVLGDGLMEALSINAVLTQQRDVMSQQHDIDSTQIAALTEQLAQLQSQLASPFEQ